MIPRARLIGFSKYSTDPEGEHRILLAVVCKVGVKGLIRTAMVDTGSEWCVASPSEFDLAPSLNEYEPAVLHSRFGTIDGSLVRAPVIFTVDGGDELTVEATWFHSEDWTGPVVLGWKGCLERMNFAFDTVKELFWFGPQEVE